MSRIEMMKVAQRENQEFNPIVGFNLLVSNSREVDIQR